MVNGTQVAQERKNAEGSDRSAVTIRADISAKRDSISETVDKLGERIHETFDWHEYVADYPAVALGLAATAGFLIAGIFKRNPTPQERIHDAIAELTEDMADRVGGVMAGVIQKKVSPGPTVKAAATAIIAKAAVHLLKKQISHTTLAQARPSQRGTKIGAPSNSDTNVETV